MKEYQKLDTPQLVELQNELGFIIATEIDLSLAKNGVLLLKGRSYDFESSEVVQGNFKEVQYTLSEDSNYDLDEDGKVIDKY
ncbi:hypothetical protein [Bacillus sp. UMB0728]|uniref:hypothetical protein n=1 Tax=Bacillus sp. UMB0728 TaxID=2066052 RepID=UPI000C77E3EF|nr:hypothetical protein [Bacillus sp. UMB0728]PLR72236.1 hypothetical protein CYJ37_11820 [Bacillus sp. UMB0728]